MIILCPCCSHSFKIEGKQPEQPKVEMRLQKAYRIIQLVADYYGITEKDLTGRVRGKQIVAARHCAMYLVYQWCGYSHKGIGNIFHRDHTTSVYAHQRGLDSYYTKQDLHRAITDLEPECEAIIHPKLQKAS